MCRSWFPGVCSFVFLIDLFADHGVEPDIDVVFVADAIEIVLQVDNFNSGRQGKIADHMKYICAREGIIIHVGGNVFNADSPKLE